MEDWQERVIEERKELGDKLSKLQLFLQGELFDALPIDEQRRMIRQECHMAAYYETLTQRIAAFDIK